MRKLFWVESLAEMKNGWDNASSEAKCRVAAEMFFMADVGASNAKPYFFCWLHNINKQFVGYVTRSARGLFCIILIKINSL